jgi:hypothetical protein
MVFTLKEVFKMLSLIIFNGFIPNQSNEGNFGIGSFLQKK